MYENTEQLDDQQSSLAFSALLDTLGYDADEYVSIGHDDAGGFSTAVDTVTNAPAYLSTLAATANIFFGVNPVAGPSRRNGGRGASGDVTRLSALWADLDVKPGACASTEVAEDIIADLSAILGTRPSAITHSGNGLHPYWPVSDGKLGSSDLAALVRRWGRLVKLVAKQRGAKADSVYDLARVLRVPGTFNNKNVNGSPAKEVVTYADSGGPLTLAEIDERLNEYGIYQEDDDNRPSVQISNPSDWRFADKQTCAYVTKLIDGIETDGPRPGDGRHQWVDKQAVRLSCAWRLGCITEADYRRAQHLLDRRLGQLRAATGEVVKRYEVYGIFEWAIERASTKTDVQACADLGDHEHSFDSPTETPCPDGEPVDGAALLDDVAAFLARFIAYPSEDAKIAHTLWIAHTHLMECWDSTPRIAFLSPEPGSGKTRALEVSEPLVPRPIHSVNVTSAYLFRKIAEDRPTLLYDEIDTVFGPKARDNEDIRGVINSGHRNGATAGRCVVHGKVVKTEELSSYCAVAMAGLNDLPDTIMDRSIVVRMQRRAADETVQPWRPRVNEPEAKRLYDRLVKWAASKSEEAKNYWPEMPEGVADRSADAWEALLSVADFCDADWPKRARVAAVALVAHSREDRVSLSVQLLHDIKDVFARCDSVALVSADLLTDLRGIEDAPWRTLGKYETGLDTRGLAKYLRKFGIRPKNIRCLGRVVKGYERQQFAEAWKRYPLPVEDDDEPTP